MIRSLVPLWHALLGLLRNLAWPLGDGANSQSEVSQAQVDDVMDAMLDDDEMDATGL